MNKLKIVETLELDKSTKIQLLNLWNNEYPSKLAHKNRESFEGYLNHLINFTHLLLIDKQNNIFGWAFSFNRENFRWFAIILSENIQGRGLGKQMLDKLKLKERALNGWVIDHNDDKKLNGQNYNSPLDFYRKCDFEIQYQIRLEKISTVKIRWINKNSTLQKIRNTNIISRVRRLIMTDEQIEKFNLLYQKACKKMTGLIIIGGYRPKKIGFFEKLRAKKAIHYFKRAISIYPDSWASLFFIGKLYQCLGNYKQSLSYLEIALKLEQTNHNIPQEASLVAMHLNQIEKAIRFSNEALRRKPDDFILLGNHSMNLLIAGLDSDAKDAIDKALLLNPNDDINQTIKNKIQAVILGQVKRPTFIEIVG